VALEYKRLLETRLEHTRVLCLDYLPYPVPAYLSRVDECASSGAGVDDDWLGGGTLNEVDISFAFVDVSGEVLRGCLT